MEKALWKMENLLVEVPHDLCEHCALCIRAKYRKGVSRVSIIDFTIVTTQPFSASWVKYEYSRGVPIGD